MPEDCGKKTHGLIPEAKSVFKWVSIRFTRFQGVQPCELPSPGSSFSRLPRGRATTTLFLTGELDLGIPADGVVVIEMTAGEVYKAVGAPERFQSIRYPETGHTYTPEMRKEMMAWFEAWLK